MPGSLECVVQLRVSENASIFIWGAMSSQAERVPRRVPQRGPSPHRLGSQKLHLWWFVCGCHIYLFFHFVSLFFLLIRQTLRFPSDQCLCLSHVSLMADFTTSQSRYINSPDYMLYISSLCSMLDVH